MNLESTIVDWRAAKCLFARVMLTSAATGGCVVGAISSIGTTNPWEYGAIGATVGAVSTAVSVIDLTKKLSRPGLTRQRSIKLELKR